MVATSVADPDPLDPIINLPPVSRSVILTTDQDPLPDPYYLSEIKKSILKIKYLIIFNYSFVS